jgi:hypothetical protein
MLFATNQRMAVLSLPLRLTASESNIQFRATLVPGVVFGLKRQMPSTDSASYSIDPDKGGATKARWLIWHRVSIVENEARTMLKPSASCKMMEWH